MGIYMEVHGYSGSPIRSIIDDMLALANRVGISVGCTCNDVRVLARPGDNAERIWQSWQDANDSSFKHKMASDQGPRTTADNGQMEASDG